MDTTTAPETPSMAIEIMEEGLKTESVAEIAASCGAKVIGEGMAPPLYKIGLATRAMLAALEGLVSAEWLEFKFKLKVK